MATIAITSYGTLGDNLPYVALGQALKARGHRVLMSIGKPMHPYALKAGLEAVSNGHPPLGPEQARQQADQWNRWLREKPPEQMMSSLNQSIPVLLEACKDADLLISSFEQDIIAGVVSGKRGIPWVRTSMRPDYFCSFSLKAKALQGEETSSNYQEIALLPYFLTYNERLRKGDLQQGLETPQDGWQHHWNLDRTIVPVSSHFCKLAPELSQVKQVGFWFYEDLDWSHWQPDKALRAFVEQEPKPLVLTYSSIPMENPQAIIEVHVRAAAQLGRRILIQQGWADFNESQLPSDIDREQVMFAGFMSQDWLFARAAALIHHGGVGTTARALRNGCPMLVEPYGNDQFFNARMVLSLGVGTAMHPERLTAEGIARVLEKKVLTEDYQKRAEEIGAKIRSEQGIITACDLIESWL